LSPSPSEIFLYVVVSASPAMPVDDLDFTIFYDLVSVLPNVLFSDPDLGTVTSRNRQVALPPCIGSLSWSRTSNSHWRRLDLPSSCSRPGRRAVRKPTNANN